MRTRRIKEGKKKKSDRMPGLKSLAERGGNGGGGGGGRGGKKKALHRIESAAILKRPGENTAHTSGVAGGGA